MRRPRAGQRARTASKDPVMADLAYVILTVAFFVALALLAGVLDRRLGR